MARTLAYLGIDVGSTTTKLVVLDESKSLLESHYLRSHGRPRQTLLGAVEGLEDRHPGLEIAGVGLTGSGGGPIADIIGGIHVNELVTQSRAVGEYYPRARTVIELGGQDSKFLSVEWDDSSRQMVLLDFAMNGVCAAGTGSFLDQQAERLGISIDEEFQAVALASENPARVAGRCTVFAKSDMIHLQQQGTPLPDILAGLCLALARNFKTVIGKGKRFAPPILFQGGVACNEAVVRAFRSVLRCQPGDLIVPEHHLIMPALGAALTAMDEAREGRPHPFLGFEELADSIRKPTKEKVLPQLHPRKPVPASALTADAGSAEEGTVEAFLGVDVGSISTCLALVDGNNRLLARRYRLTGGKPLEAVRDGLLELEEELDYPVRVLAAGATGSGRYLTGHFIGADVIRNEITAQARAAAAIDPEVDTIFEIGGQDSKYIRMQKGAVVDFAMNNACAAGTGSFLEEQAERLDISIKEDFAPMALAAPTPACLGERCTVFMESDVVHHQQRGATVEDLTAGLAYSIVHNYLNRVVNGREVGRRVLFQGGVALNHSVASAFEQVLGQDVIVPPQTDVTGAIGAAILAREAREARGAGAESAFRGFNLTEWAYDATSFICQACPNLCEIKKVVIGEEPPIYYGARCDKFEEAGRGPKNLQEGLTDLFAEREELLLEDYDEPGGRMPGRRRVGIPRSLIFNELFPYWRAFFAELGMDVVLSGATSPKTIRDTQDHAEPECCLPVKLVYGHVLDLMERDLDYVFLPSIMDREDPPPGQTHNHYCPLIPASSQLVAAHLDIQGSGAQPLLFPLHLQQEQIRAKELKPLARQLGLPLKALRAAARAGERAQERFYRRVRERGAQVLGSLSADTPAVVLVGRPYNTCDLGVCQDLPLKLRKLGALPIPIDMLPLRSVDISERHADMFWRSGQDILAAGKIIADDPRLQAIYLTSFDCGPDSFLVSFFRRMLGDKPFLELEVDDHTAEAGIVTRCEAFLDSLNLSARA